MIRVLLKIFKYLLVFLVSLLILFAGAGAFLYFTADRSIPENTIPDVIPSPKDSLGTLIFGQSSLEKGAGGLWNLRLKGDPQERGLAFGQLCKSLMYKQEKAFVDQIKILVPNESYLSLLKYLTVIYNRNIQSNIEDEFRKEIYATSLGSSDEFNFIGDKYDRQLNYHAAHDLGHAMQEYMLVGCTSFAAWGKMSEDSSLVVARNFDFWVGDAFAENKLVTIMEPDSGYKFVSIGWAGMSGVLSGMNEEGLTITMNAAKSSPPIRSKTPISIIAREILQYASNIDEAFQIASKRDAFVSESLLIGSARENRAAIIEKRPQGTRLYTTKGELIVSTNHFLSDDFFSDPKSKDAVESIAGSHSEYRFRRIEELVSTYAPLSILESASILRDPDGLSGEYLGLGNEMSINQYIAHHSVIFKPIERIMWVSTSPWQLGKMIKYDLNELFNLPGSNLELLGDIPADSIQIVERASLIIKFREESKYLMEETRHKKRVSDDFSNKFISLNPNFFQTYLNLGDNYYSAGDNESAADMYKMALKLKLPSNNIKSQLENKLEKL
ncbi:MAG: C45 family autoproteolytic acyltransferase/hydrolase [Bacteroidales bacterium]|jgi:hypothetical protein|nr:C45 family autoproteolytic acyltransferase/hydrolase [Bacteroidales bacterium]